MGSDGRNPYDVLTINGASAALMLSGLPFDGPIGAVRMAFDIDGEWVPHPEHDEIEESTFDLVVAGQAARQRDHGQLPGGRQDRARLREARRGRRHRGR